MNVVLKKIKITKSIIEQMYELPFKMFGDNLDILGYVNVDKYVSKLIIVYHCDNKECYKLNGMWEKRGSYLGYNGNFRGEMVKRVSNIDDWYEAYLNIISRANIKGHLYI